MIFKPCSEQLNELFAALAKAQGEMDVASKTSANPFFKSRYADLEQIVQAARPALSKNGLSVTQLIWDEEDGFCYVYTKLGHSSGQFICSRKKINAKAEDNASIGSATTYVLRRAFQAITGVVAGDNEDDDGQAADQIQGDTMRKQPQADINEAITQKQREEIDRLTKLNAKTVAQACVDLHLDITKLNKKSATQLLNKLIGPL
jgi:hypothetical protein